jgi:hypothetical protein
LFTNGKLDKLIEKSGLSLDQRVKTQRRKGDDDEGGVRGFLSGIFD